jgi:hypothetical protein
MRKLPLTMLGAMTGVGKMTGADQAEPREASRSRYVGWPLLWSSTYECSQS